jgi:hypothetical protein
LRWGKPVWWIERNFSQDDLVEHLAFRNINPWGEQVEDTRIEAIRAQIAVGFEQLQCQIANLMRKKGSGKANPSEHKLSEFMLFERMGVTREDRERADGKKGSAKRQGSGIDFRNMTQEQIAEAMNAHANKSARLT